MTSNPLLDLIEYPESDGKPITESDPTRDYLLYCVEALDTYFQNQPDVYVSGNLFIYYRQGEPKAVVSPDVFVVFGVPKQQRRSYQTWKEGVKLPDFVMEITSKSTRKEDEQDKPALYAQLGIQEYFQYDPTGDYLRPQLKGQRLVNGKYQLLPVELSPEGSYSIFSQVLGLDLRLVAARVPLFNLDTGARIRQELRFFDRQGNRLMSYKETEQARKQAEQARNSAVPRLLALGLTPEQVAEALQLTVLEVERLA